jgi:hypothetical protein
MNRNTTTLSASMLRGALGFALLGVAGFLPWAMSWTLGWGEAGMYSLCLIFFVVLSGPLLGGLMQGRGGIGKFYAVFWIAFGAYAAVWCAFWFAVPVAFRDYYGLGLGCAVFALISAWMLGGLRGWWLGALFLIALHGLGYWLGGQAYASMRPLESLELPGGLMLNRSQCVLVAKLAWGLFYGIGFGAGMGSVFYFSQKNRYE